MIKSKFRLIACSLIISMITILPSISVNASSENNISATNNVIKKVTKQKNVITNTTSTDGFVAISDGENSTIKVPSNANLPIVIKSSDDDNRDFSINLPKEAKKSKIIKTDSGNILYKTNNSNSFATQLISENNIMGVRNLIMINDSNASKKYEFKFNLPKGSKLVTDSEYLGKEFSSGEIFIVDKNNIITGTIDKAWAYDAKGVAVPTKYEIIDNNKLVQTVDFKSTNAFPIVADPSAWQITKCVGAISWALGSSIFAGLKLIKIKRYISALGGLRTAARLLVGASSVAEKWKAGGSALVGLAAEISGVAAIKESCFV